MRHYPQNQRLIWKQPTKPKSTEKIVNKTHKKLKQQPRKSSESQTQRVSVPE